MDQSEQRKSNENHIPNVITSVECGNKRTDSNSSDTVTKSDPAAATSTEKSSFDITYTIFQEESQLHALRGLIDKELSEPYSIYTYRYFVYNWPQLCFMAKHEDRFVGVIVCKLEEHYGWKRGYIAMLAVENAYRKHKIGTTLTLKAIEALVTEDVEEIILETELTNKAAVLLYESLGFIRTKRLQRYYMNGVDALRMKLYLK